MHVGKDSDSALVSSCGVSRRFSCLTMKFRGNHQFVKSKKLPAGEAFPGVKTQA